MTPMGQFIVDLCDEIERKVEDWDFCPTCGNVVPYLRKNLDSGGVTPTKLRVRSLMQELKRPHPELYKKLNDRFLVL